MISDRVTKRMAWIETCLRRHGRFLKDDYVCAFGVSAPQVSLDLKTFCALANEQGGDLCLSHGRIEGSLPPDPMYARTPLLTWLESLGDADLFTDVASSARRPPDEAICDEILRAINQRKALNVEYFSLSSGGSRKILSCHHLVHALGRLHVRAYDHERSRYADFVIGRIEAISGWAHTPYRGSEFDKDWHTFVDLEFCVAANLPASRQATVKREFGLDNNESGVINVRKALRIYAAITLGIYPPNYSLPLELASETDFWPED